MLSEGYMAVRGRVSLAIAQGMRDEQQDFPLHLERTLPDGSTCHLLAVFDGHVFRDTAKYCVERLRELFQVTSPKEASLYLRNLIAHLNVETRGMGGGTTLSIACVFEGSEIVQAYYLGDSPVLIAPSPGVLVASMPHSVLSHAAERERVQSLGAEIHGPHFCDPKSGCGLQCTRALGDAVLDHFLSRTPDGIAATLSAKSSVVVCTDGLLDLSVPGPVGAKELMEHVCRGYTAKEVLAWREDRKALTDNASIIIWQTV
jgi:serine/threonine protein phosphatase PrpC